MSGHARGPAMVWALLCGLTIASVGFVEAGWRGEWCSAVIVLLAATKSRLVILHYMEARRAAAHWRLLYETWNFAAAATIVVGLFMQAAA